MSRWAQIAKQKGVSLLPIIPQSEQLTGMKVKYLILPEEEYFQKIEVDRMPIECP